MALLTATIIILVAIAGVAILLRATILDIAGLVRGDLACQSQMQQRRYDDVVGLCERIEAILEANQAVPSKGLPTSVINYVREQVDNQV